MRLFHRHKWVALVENASGSFEKQQGQDGIFYCRGQLQVCPIPCGEARLKPHDPTLRPVAVEL